MSTPDPKRRRTDDESSDPTLVDSSKLENFVKATDGHQESGQSWVVCVDGSEQSLNALKWTLRVLDKSQDRLGLVFVREPVHHHFPHASAYFTQIEQQLNQEQITRAQHILDSYKTICDEAGVKYTSTLLVGKPKQALVDFVEHNSVDNLVIGRHGGGSTERRILGSVSDYCAQHAHANVLIIK